MIANDVKEKISATGSMRNGFLVVRRTMVNGEALHSSASGVDPAAEGAQ